MLTNFYQLGDWVPVGCVCRNASGTPTEPDNVPQARIHSSDGALVENVALPIRDRYGTTAFFAGEFNLDSNYSAGDYYVIYQWETGGGAFAGKEYQSFRIVAGGDADGAVIGTQYHDVPEARLVIYQLDGGLLLSRRNPR